MLIVCIVIWLLGLTASASAEPISTAIGLTALLVEFGVGAGFAGAIGGAFISIGAAFGLTQGAKLLQGGVPVEPSQAVNDPGTRFNERQSIPNKRIPYGLCYTGGALFFEQVQPPYLYQGVLLSDRRITSLENVWIGTNTTGLTYFPENTILAPVQTVNSGLTDRRNLDLTAVLQLSLRFGSATQAVDPILAANFANLSTEFRQRGIATAVLRYRYGTSTPPTQAEFISLWGQVQRPSPFFLFKGVAVPDPRIPTHTLNWDINDPAAVLAAEATWSYSNNASLCQAHYLTQKFGGRVKPSTMNWDKVARAADYDDEVIGCKDGTFIKKHTIDGLVTMNQRPIDVMASMLSANRGFVLESRGRVWVSSSKPRDAIATVYDDILVGGLQYRAARPKRDLLNKVSFQFLAQELNYQMADGPTLSNATYQTVDQETLAAALSLPFTLDHRRGQRLAKTTLEGGRLGRMITCAVNIKFLTNCADDIIGSVVKFDSVLFPQANGTYLVVSVKFNTNFSAMELVMIEYDKTVESSWIAANDEQTFSVANLNLT